MRRVTNASSACGNNEGRQKLAAYRQSTVLRQANSNTQCYMCNVMCAISVASRWHDIVGPPCNKGMQGKTSTSNGVGNDDAWYRAHAPGQHCPDLSHWCCVVMNPFACIASAAVPRLDFSRRPSFVFSAYSYKSSNILSHGLCP